MFSGKYVISGIIDARVHYHIKTGDWRTADDFINSIKAAICDELLHIVDFAAGGSYADYNSWMPIYGCYHTDLMNSPVWN